MEPQAPVALNLHKTTKQTMQMPFRNQRTIAKFATAAGLAISILLVQACTNFRVRSQEVQDGLADIANQKAKSDCRRHLNQSDYSDCMARVKELEAQRKLDKPAP